MIPASLRCCRTNCNAMLLKATNRRVLLRGLFCTTVTSTSSDPYEKIRQKIIFNSVLTYYDSLKWSKKERQKEYLARRSHVSDAIFLKYLKEEPEVNHPAVEENVEESSSHIKFPFQTEQHVTFDKNYSPQESASDDDVKWVTSADRIISKLIKDKNWLPHDPDMKKDKVRSDKNVYDLKYGTVGPEIPVSNVPCGGCGALLHCQDTSIPGFLPKEIFHGLKKVELQTQVCQRCHYLKDYDIALGIDVSPEDYPKILSPIQHQKALVLLMVDVLDLPCSIWPGIMDVIGNKRPIVVVANKIDLLVQDSVNFLDSVQESLVDCLLEAGMPRANIKHIALISAKSGYGVEELITQIQESWQSQGDIYIVGCTNVGKSTLFNTLIQSDLCKVQAVDVMQRATVSQWPGTTLNLLKFPILRPSSWRLGIRKARLVESKQKELTAAALRIERLRNSRYRKQSSLTGEVGRSFLPASPMTTVSDPFSVAISNNPRGVSPLGLNPDMKAFTDSKWCYDTPGVVHPDQIINLLTTPELISTIPKQLIVPRLLHLAPGHSVFIGGLARVDYVRGPEFVWLSVFAASTLPLTVVKTEDADAIYNELLGTELLRVPSGNEERLKKWPGLTDKSVEVAGKSYSEVAADLVLSSAGWVAVTLQPAEVCILRAWTPEARGIYLRLPLIKNAHKFRAKRIMKTPVYRRSLSICE